MNTSFFRSLMSAGLLSCGLPSPYAAEPITPPLKQTYPAPSIPTNAVAVPYTLPPRPFFQQTPLEHFTQHIAQRAADPLTPATFISLSDQRGYFANFVNDTGRAVALGAGKRTLRDYATSRILPELELNGAPLTEVRNYFLFGSLQGMQERDLKARTTLFPSPTDLTLRPLEAHPLSYSWGLDPFRENPKAYATVSARGGTRVLRLDANYDRSELAFDILGGETLVRFGARLDHHQFDTQSSGFVSFSPFRWRIPLNVSVASTYQGNVTVSTGLRFPF